MSWGNAFKGLILGGLPGAAIGGLIGNDDEPDKPPEAPSHESWGKDYSPGWSQADAPNASQPYWIPTAKGINNSYGTDTGSHPNRQVSPGGSSGSW
jgi:hypothetical protein